MRLSIILLALILMPITCIAMAGDINPIDVSMNECLQKSENSTTAGMNTCVHKATLLWEQEMLSTYERLANHLNGQARIDLEASQKAWLAFRESEKKAINSILSNVQGTMHTNIRAMMYQYIIKNRATALKSYARAVDI